MGALTATRRESLLGKILYGALFVVIVPGLGGLWAQASEDVVGLPAVHAPNVGAALLTIGLLTMGAAMWALRVRGGGLPMNAFPPPRRVVDGIFRLVRHPIYCGFTVASLGVSLAFGSASGLWLVTPLLTLGWCALVWGYENRDLGARFGPPHPTVLELPQDEVRSATLAERLGFFAVVLLPWCLAYEAVILLGAPSDAISLALPFEPALPVWTWTEAVYVTPYLMAIAVPLLLPTASALRRLGVRVLLASAIAFPLYVLLPIISPPRPFSDGGVLGALLLFERAMDSPAAAFPSFHVAWAWLLQDAIGTAFPRARPWARLWALAVAASCVTTGMHTLADVVAGFALAIGVPRLPLVWTLLRAEAERLANGLTSWSFGRVRVLSYGAFGFVGTFVVVAGASVLAGPSSTGPLALAVVLSILGAGAWAQVVERGASLSRPFGFYGGLLGFIAGAAMSPVAGGETDVVLAALAVTGPLLQAMGRLRCLQQGCCHGAPASERLGIRYRHPLSRVVKMTSWRDVPLHPTPLYSLLWSVFISAFLLRLWTAGAACGLIGGLFLVLNGLGRFVEEGLRGEPQTPIVFGLRLYQHLALLSIVAGALVTAFGSRRAAPALEPSLVGIAAGFVLALVVGVVSGVDFPSSSRRLSRLA